MYLLGNGVQKDQAAARHWFEVGVKLGDPSAEYSLGLLLSTDPSRTEDLKRAVKLMRESADAGLVTAKHELGFLLVQNPQLARSPKEASALLEDAAAAGSWKSSLILGVLARDGRGTPVDLDGAYYHFRVATLQGGDAASQLLKNDLQILAAKLTAERTRAIDSDAGAWYQTHHLSLAYVYQPGENWKQYPFFALESPEGDIHAGRIIPTSPF
jgi:TPR repeat protein